MRVTGVTPQFQPPSRQTPSRRMWITIALCILLPPVGLILLWGTMRAPLRGKIIISIIAVLSMTLMITIFLMSRAHEIGRISNDALSSGIMTTTAPDESTPSTIPQAQPVIVEPSELDEDVNHEFVPANPVG